MNKKGFTLIELVVAIAIMGVIMVIALPAINTFTGDNETKKYTAYEKTLKSAAKMYTDSYDEDLFGYKNTGCQTITYQQLKDKKLIEDISLSGVTCDPEDTYVFVYKDKNSNHAYFSSIKCKKDGKVVYTNKEREVSECGLEDGDAPTIEMKTQTYPPDLIEKPYNNGLYHSEHSDLPARYPTVKITLKDVNAEGEGAIGLRPGYQNLKYQWYKQTYNSSEKVKVTGTNSSGKIDLNPKEYFVTEMSTTIPHPADMESTATGVKDTYYFLEVTGTVQDMDNNTETRTSTNPWTPDYEKEVFENGAKDDRYDVERHKKCPTYTFTRNGTTIPNSSLSGGNYWVNGNTYNVQLKVTPTTGITKFNAAYYQLRRSQKGGAYSEYDTHFSSTKSYRIGENFNGSLQFNSYYTKKDHNTRKYQCPSTYKVNFDYDNPVVTLGLTTGTGAKIKATAKGDNGEGYKDQIVVRSTCSDPTSSAKLTINNTSKTSPFTETKSARGTYSYTAVCTDLASNKSKLGSYSYRVLKYTENCTKCGVKTYNSCRTSACGCDTYKRASKCGCETRNSCRHSSCGCQTYNRGSGCGCETRNSCRAKTCGCQTWNKKTVTDYNNCTIWANGSKSSHTGRRCAVYGTKQVNSTCKTYKSCRNSSCSCATYKRCSSAGCATYNSCRNSSCSCATYKRCKAAGCQTWNKCRAEACGCEVGNSCWY